MTTSGLFVRSGVLRLGCAGVLPAPTALQTAVSVAEGREKELAAAHVAELAACEPATTALAAEAVATDGAGIVVELGLHPIRYNHLVVQCSG